MRIPIVCLRSFPGPLFQLLRSFFAIPASTLHPSLPSKECTGQNPSRPRPGAPLPQPAPRPALRRAAAPLRRVQNGARRRLPPAKDANQATRAARTVPRGSLKPSVVGD
eukprot:6182740-Pleurochrysis_carterae.AAC.1